MLGERLTLDAKLRRDRLEAEVESLTTGLDAYNGATPGERRTLWDRTVLLEERFDPRTGRSIRLTEPEEVDTEVYFKENVPHLIKLRREWAERMGDLIEHLDAAVHRPHAPAQQLAVGRFFDAALRGAWPAESPATEQAFAAWQRETAPVLWFEWRCALRREGIAPADLFTRHTVLLTRYLPATAEDRAVLFTHPYTVVDSTRSAVLADAERGVTVVRDATDHAERAEPGSGTAAAEEVWDELVRLAEEPSREDEFSRKFVEMLRTHPHAAVSRLLEELAPDRPSGEEADGLDTELRRAERATSVSEGMDRALMAMRNKAFLTARECLDSVQNAAEWEARAWLLRAVVECVESELDPREIPAVLGSEMAGVPGEASRALALARRLDEGFSTEWLEAMSEPDADLNKGIRRLFQGLPQARASCTERGYAVLLFRRAVQSVRLARELEEASEELADRQESVDVAPLAAVVGEVADCVNDEAAAVLLRPAAVAVEPGRPGHHRDDDQPFLVRHVCGVAAGPGLLGCSVPPPAGNAGTWRCGKRRDSGLGQGVQRHGRTSWIRLVSSPRCYQEALFSVQLYEKSPVSRRAVDQFVHRH